MVYNIYNIKNIKLNYNIKNLILNLFNIKNIKLNYDNNLAQFLSCTKRIIIYNTLEHELNS